MRWWGLYPHHPPSSWSPHITENHLKAVLFGHLSCQWELPETCELRERRPRARGHVAGSEPLLHALLGFLDIPPPREDRLQLRRPNFVGGRGRSHLVITLRGQDCSPLMSLSAVQSPPEASSSQELFLGKRNCHVQRGGFGFVQNMTLCFVVCPLGSLQPRYWPQTLSAIGSVRR